ncbi:MAG TPA: helix-turn-helix transcriptional regulator [Thermoanaerobaculia bacterium]
MRSRTPQPNEVFGQHLRALRRERQMTQEALAERADLGVNIVGRLERAIIAPGLVTLLKLSVALGVPAKELLDPFTPDVVTRMKVAPSPSSKTRR